LCVASFILAEISVLVMLTFSSCTIRSSSNFPEDLLVEIVRDRIIKQKKLEDEDYWKDVVKDVPKNVCKPGLSPDKGR
jgi:hypothetical protein